MTVPSSFETIGKPELLSQTVEAAIEASIRRGVFGMGDRLPSEMELCGEFGVSRTVMREALRMLSARGLVDIKKGRGIFVGHLPAETVTHPLELYLHMHSGSESGAHVVAARQIIEPAIVREAADRHTQADALRLRANLDALAAARDHAEMSALDMAFHTLLAEATHNPVLALVVRPIQMLMPAIMTDVYRVVGDAQESAVDAHTQVVDAVLARDAAAAAAAMQRHLDRAMEHLRLLTEAGTAETT